MYARNLTEDVIKDRIVEEVDTERFRAHHRVDAGGSGQARAEPVGHRRQVRRGQGAPPGARGDRGLLRAGRRRDRRSLPDRARRAQAGRTSTGSARCRMPRGIVRRSDAGAPLRPAGPRVQRRSSSTSKLLQDDPTLEWVTPGHPLFEAVRSRGLAAGPAGPGARRRLLRPEPRPAQPAWTCSARAVKDGRGNTLHQRLFVVETDADGADDGPPADALPRPDPGAARARPRRRRRACRTAPTVEQVAGRAERLNDFLAEVAGRAPARDRHRRPAHGDQPQRADRPPEPAPGRAASAASRQATATRCSRPTSSRPRTGSTS